LRLTPKQKIAAGATAGLKLSRLIEVPPYHYGAVFERSASKNTLARCRTLPVWADTAPTRSAEHAAIASLRFQLRPASFAHIDVLAGVGSRKHGSMAPSKDAAQKVESRLVPRGWSKSRGLNVPEYLLCGAYTLLALGVVCCLAFIASNFEDEDPAPKADRDP
jgi:hypothetical protein